MKIFFSSVCVLCFLVAIPAVSDDLSYSRDSAKKYMEESENSYLVIKVGGYISNENILEKIEGYLGEDLARKALKKVPQNRDEYFVVLTSYKGSFKPGDVIRTVAMDSHLASASIGQEYFILLTKNVSPLAYPDVQLVYDQCGLFNVHKVSEDTLSNFNSIVKHLLENGKVPCLWTVQYEKE